MSDLDMFTSPRIEELRDRIERGGEDGRLAAIQTLGWVGRDTWCNGCGSALHSELEHGDEGCTKCTCQRYEAWR